MMPHSSHRKRPDTFARADFSVLRYSLPSGTAADYAQQAIDVLQTLPVPLLHYALAADMVLTLSGVRAFDTFIVLEDLAPGDISQLQGKLEAHGFTLRPEADDYVSGDFYSLINHAALGRIPSQYAIEGWFDPKPPYTSERMAVWAYYMDGMLRNLMFEGKLPKDWLAYPRSAPDIRSGILLGYPGEAIASVCWMDVLGEEIEDAPKASIAYHDAYDAAWPVYAYKEEVRGNPNILAHQKLWSDILTQVYESPWHRSLKITTDTDSGHTPLGRPSS
jgi:hypothetical protein